MENLGEECQVYFASKLYLIAKYKPPLYRFQRTYPK